jgi:hypothetical protein
MKCCPVVPEICRGQVHASRKERRIRIIIIKIKIIIRNGAKTISLQTLFGRLNDQINLHDFNINNIHVHKLNRYGEQAIGYWCMNTTIKRMTG